MSAISYRGFSARVDFDAADGLFVGRIIGINDVIGFHADTVAGLTDAFHNAVDDYVEACKTVGKEPEKAFSGKVMFRVSPAVHAQAVLAAQLAGKSLNQWAEDALKQAAAQAPLFMTDRRRSRS